MQTIKLHNVTVEKSVKGRIVSLVRGILGIPKVQSDMVIVGRGGKASVIPMERTRRGDIPYADTSEQKGRFYCIAEEGCSEVGVQVVCGRDGKRYAPFMRDVASDYAAFKIFDREFYTLSFSDLLGTYTLKEHNLRVASPGQAYLHSEQKFCGDFSSLSEEFPRFVAAARAVQKKNDGMVGVCYASNQRLRTAA